MIDVLTLSWNSVPEVEPAMRILFLLDFLSKRLYWVSRLDKHFHWMLLWPCLLWVMLDWWCSLRIGHNGGCFRYDSCLWLSQVVVVFSLEVSNIALSLIAHLRREWSLSFEILSLFCACETLWSVLPGCDLHLWRLFLHKGLFSVLWCPSHLLLVYGLRDYIVEVIFVDTLAKLGLIREPCLRVWMHRLKRILLTIVTEMEVVVLAWIWIWIRCVQG